jgi:hypothetical protein
MLAPTGRLDRCFAERIVVGCQCAAAALVHTLPIMAYTTLQPIDRVEGVWRGRSSDRGCPAATGKLGAV